VHRHGRNQREFGIGISKHYLAKQASLFAMMYIRVYDGQTFELIKQAPALTTEDTYIERVLHNPLGGPLASWILRCFRTSLPTPQPTWCYATAYALC
jgi:hypothetical protein